MSGWNSWGVRRKLFSIILIILVLNVVILFFMGTMLFERFYQTSKIAELKAFAMRIQEAYAQNSDTIYDEINSIENKNVNVCLISVSETGELEFPYRSRGGGGKQDAGKVVPYFEITIPPEVQKREQQYQQALLERIQRTGREAVVEIGGVERTGWKDWTPTNTKGDDGKGNNHPDNSISLLVEMDDNLYLYVQTPLGYLKSTADLAVQYTALLSIAILACGAVVIYFVVNRMTKPLSEIGVVAGQIAKLDFSRHCEVVGNDEIGQLATSVNQMSQDLQAAVDRMLEANTVLQNDLVRQQQTDQMRRQFVANVSHDFKTPLTLMISYAEALRESEQLNEQDRDYLEIIVSEGNRLSRMVGKLLGLSKLESGIDKIEQSYFCLREVVDAVRRRQNILTEKRRLTVTQTFVEDFIVQADYQKIEQVLTNLFENAVKYAPEEGEIRIIADRWEGLCRVTVENTGKPIAEEQLGSLYDSFYRADQARNTVDSFGLGLAIVKVVMEAHRQPYGVENLPDGVRFWFALDPADFEDDAVEDE